MKLDVGALESSKTKDEKESARLKLELEQIVFDFAKKKNELETAYQQ